jgi:hypothetical protein
VRRVDEILRLGRATREGVPMPAETTAFFRLEDLEDVSRTGDLDALRAVADWIEAFVIRPHKDLGRAGPVCPFVDALDTTPVDTAKFSGRYAHRTVEGGVGHNLPQEAPDAFSDAVLELGAVR